MRTLLKDGMPGPRRQTVSLVMHLGARGINLLRTVPELSPNTLMFTGLITLRLSGRAATYGPQMGGTPFHRFVPAETWWTEIVNVTDAQAITRSSLTLVAAEKAGGAHVDAEFLEAYEALVAGGGGAIVSRNRATGEERLAPFPDLHLMCLRQVRCELLNSPELLALAA